MHLNAETLTAKAVNPSASCFFGYHAGNCYLASNRKAEEQTEADILSLNQVAASVCFQSG